jgi:hypothetical protein
MTVGGQGNDELTVGSISGNASLGENATELVVSDAIIIGEEYSLPLDAGTTGQVITWPSSGTDPTWAAAGGGTPSAFVKYANKIGSNAKYFSIGYERVVANTQRTHTIKTTDTYLFPFRADYTGTCTGLSLYTIGGTAPDPSAVIVAVYDSDSDGAPQTRLGYNTFDTSGVSSGTYFNDTAIDDSFDTTGGDIYWLAVTASGSNVGVYGWDRQPMRIQSTAMPIFYYTVLRLISGGAVPASTINTGLLYQTNAAGQPNIVMTYSGL